MEKFLEDLKEISKALERDPKLWTEAESVFVSSLSNGGIGMSNFGDLTRALESIFGPAARVFRAVGIDPVKFSDLEKKAMEQDESVKMGLDLIKHIRHTYSRVYRRAEILARYGPMAWFSTSVSVGKGGDVMIEITRADGERFTVHLRDEEMLKKFLESIGRSLEIHGLSID